MKMTISAKLGGAFSIALFVIFIVGIAALISIRKLVADSGKVSHTHEVIAIVDKVAFSMRDADADHRAFLLTTLEDYAEEFSDDKKRVDSALDELRVKISDNEEQKPRINALAEYLEGRFKLMDDSLEARKSAGLDAAVAIFQDDENRRLRDSISKTIGEIKAAEYKLLKERSDSAQTQVNLTKGVIIGGIALALVLLVALWLMLKKDIAGSIEEVASAAQEISAGNLNPRLPTRSKTQEIELLVDSFQRMSSWLSSMAKVSERIAGGDLTAEVNAVSDRDLLGNSFARMRVELLQSTSELQEAANVLASSSSEILSSSSQVAAATSETATALAETTTTVEEVKQTVQVSSEKAKLVADNAKQASVTARTGREAVENSIDGLRRIREQMESIAETVVRLSEQSQTIGEITASVADIAEQSNLLAVNAAIEAARAGEHGRGFGVVAQEIKSLAEQSKQATAQVRGILNDIQKAITSAVMATEQGGKIVEIGVVRGEEASDAIAQLAETIEAGAQAAMQIAASSRQQFIGIDQVASAMENIKEASKQNAAGTRQTEAAARDLHNVGKKLSEIAGRYKTARSA